MANKEIAKIFIEMAELLNIRGDSAFHINAYRKSAAYLENLKIDIAEIYKEKGFEGLKVPRIIGDKNAKKIDRSEFEKEGYLQNYIHENPESIPVYEIEEDKKLFVVAREFPTESGPIDALAIDKDGDIYVVETKLYII